MILYNVTVHLEEEVHSEWLSWMLQKHIPDVMKTGYFTDYQMFKILSNPHEGIGYAIQYFCRSEADLAAYQEKCAPALQAEHQQKYEGKCFAFRTVMEKVEKE